MKFLVVQLNTVMETRGPPKTLQVSPVHFRDNSSTPILHTNTFTLNQLSQ